MPLYRIRPLPLRDPIQQVIDRQMRSLAGALDQPPDQKHCHPHGILEMEITEAIDEKASFGDYEYMISCDAFSLMR